jgi:hypothetical protein
MKKFQHTFIALVFIALVFPLLVAAQDIPSDVLRFEVNRIYQPLSISHDQLNEARTLEDLNKYYKSSWVQEYISVEIITSHEGNIKKAMSKNDMLSPEQISHMTMADDGSDISIKVRYIPENTLKHNEAKEFNFNFIVYPEIEATYVGGQQQLTQYLKENAIDKIPPGSLDEKVLAAVKFTVDHTGNIIDVHTVWSSEDETIDNLLLETIHSMPAWKPAEYSTGLKTNQEFVFMVGNMESCVVNLLNLRRDK